MNMGTGTGTTIGQDVSIQDIRLELLRFNGKVRKFLTQYPYDLKAVLDFFRFFGIWIWDPIEQCHERISLVEAIATYSLNCVRDLPPVYLYSERIEKIVIFNGRP